MNSQDDLKYIIEKLELLEKKIDSLVDTINEDVKPNCSRMNTHIDFIEKVYNVVKSPLGFVCERINYVSKNKTYELSESEKQD